jgi:acetyltransferase-like isoleucine patch superfamily enzyme
VIRPHTVIESGVSIGKRCAIGPVARLRRGVAIDNDARVGNFAELVRTRVGQRVRINHLSYLGDATIEEAANIGAGTITANYDGTAKHPTFIGKGAFIGSDTVLIAPVKVGPGAVTGAGSVVPKAHDVPPRTVVVGVPARPLKNGAGGPVRPLKPGAPEADGHAAKKPSRRPALQPAVKRRRAPKMKARVKAKPKARRAVARPAPKRGKARRHAVGARR